MIGPDDDFEVDFDDGDPVLEVEAETMTAAAATPVHNCHDTRRKIEEILERKRLKEEFGDLDF